jgi:hypothetical protein
MSETEKNKTYSSSKGVTLTLRPVSQFKIDSMRSSKEEIQPPTYEVKVAGGESLMYPMDEEIAKNKGRLDEWRAYIEKRKAAEADHTKKFMELMIWEGIEVDVPDQDSEWQKTSEHFGLKVPCDPVERKLFYVYNELLGTPEDIGELIAQIFSASQIDEGAVTRLRESFRLGVQRTPNSELFKKQRKLANKKPNTQRP